MNVLCIDIGIKNPGIVIIKTTGIYNINIHIIVDTWEKLTVMQLDKLCDYAKIDVSYTVVIEQQFRGTKNIFISGFLKAYFECRKYKVVVSKPATYGLKIKKYNDRKKYTMNIMNNLIPLDINIKIDDIADALCLGLRYIYKNDFEIKCKSCCVKNITLSKNCYK